MDQHQILRQDEMFPPIPSGAFLEPPFPEPYADIIETASAASFVA